MAITDQQYKVFTVPSYEHGEVIGVVQVVCFTDIIALEHRTDSQLVYAGRSLRNLQWNQAVLRVRRSFAQTTT
jgi:hypothetical protein